MSVTTVTGTVGEQSVLSRATHLVLTLQGPALVAVLPGQGVPAHAASPAAALATASTTASTRDVGPLLGWSQDTVWVTSDATSRWPGTIRRTHDTSTNKLATVTTTLNDRWAEHVSCADRLDIAEHELGQGVGLPPVKRTSSIMNAVVHGRTKPAAGDLRDLDARS